MDMTPHADGEPVRTLPARMNDRNHAAPTIGARAKRIVNDRDGTIRR